MDGLRGTNQPAVDRRQAQRLKQEVALETRDFKIAKKTSKWVFVEQGPKLDFVPPNLGVFE